ncbi:hypothetical protein COT82_02785 [Candidatus Campbellbacteria bacterium CG10_big_fil_rev_8_21_14_0_10_35_52]|uniref:Uncharacterized protein n=1 Tax=Candidatus Campbellbacteria bacterium CG10_big_fil_rev_8_21_14_0_10_35_52 TaxID=1974527 RepID=A0A2M6WV00_9BACT|nr:MAG: hypothetical protein COT82_02785 [Candidatus Campbellbacteria bacterium CG10_big_fil_rev_8_21_14_0_10_35_52]
MGFETPKFEAPKKETGEKSNLNSEQQKMTDADKNKAFETFKKSVGTLEVQTAKLKVKDLTEGLERHKKDPRMLNDMETIKWYEREIALNQRVVNGEKLTDVLDSIRSKEDEERIKEAIKSHNEMKQEGDREKNKEEPTSTPEQKEHPKKFSKVREYLKYIFELSDDDDEIKQGWQEAEANLDYGNQLATMAKLERMATGEHFSQSTKTKNLWRNAIFEIGQEVYSSTRLIDVEALGQSLYEEFMKLNKQMDSVIEDNPSDWSEKDKKNYDKEVLRWQDASNEVLTYGRSENALILLEQNIDNMSRYDRDLREVIEQGAKRKNVSLEYINKTKELIDTNSKKLAAYRRMRDSLYAIEFSK